MNDQEIKDLLNRIDNSTSKTEKKQLLIEILDICPGPDIVEWKDRLIKHSTTLSEIKQDSIYKNRLEKLRKKRTVLIDRILDEDEIIHRERFINSNGHYTTLIKTKDGFTYKIPQNIVRDENTTI